MNLFLLGLGAVYLYLTYQLPSRSIAGDPGIKVVPYVIGVLTFALAAYHVARDGFKQSKSIPWRLVANVGIVSLVMLAYVGLMNLLGFEVSTILFLMAVAGFFGRSSTVKEWLIVGLFSVVTTVAISLLFGSVFNVNLPDGSWLSSGKGW